MPRNEGLLQYVVEEVLGDIPGITTKAMFGGYGIYKDGIVFAMIIRDTLYFKTDESNRAEFEKRGSKPFMYHHRSGKTIAMSYYQLPPDIMEDKDEVKKWVERSLVVSKKKK